MPLENNIAKMQRNTANDAGIPKLNKDDEDFINSLIRSRKQTENYLNAG